MEILSEKFRKTYSSPIRSDRYSHTKYEAIKEATVQEVCECILKTNEWGYIGIKQGDWVPFGSPHVEYTDHKYVDEYGRPIKFSFPPEIANAFVSQIDWDGGWSRGDWLLTLKRR